ncbi:YveK family protein [Proteocatella sphenisci]|uniref:YveK family protein n=1 Tax=Proteocatella sphenisci TaxID=181070 RepID=UPI00048C61A0|nr:Wzz/FepE/Etk N-terminal domain-containing protein [Proteocatella sphenisci]
MNEEIIELRELLEILLKRKLLIIILTVVCTLAGGIYSVFMITPLYKSETTMMVNGAKNMTDIASSLDLGSINLSQKLVVTYGEIVKSRIVLEQTIKTLKLDMTYEQLLQKTTAQQLGGTEILKISVEDEDPKNAAIIANKISGVFVKEVMRILKVNNVETIDKAIAIDKPININTALNLAISMILGLMAGVFIAFILEYMDNTIKTENDVQKYLDLPILGLIPDHAMVLNEQGEPK